MGMKMLLQIILLVTMYPAFGFMYLAARSCGKPKNGYCFGASVKQEWLLDEEVGAIRKTYRKQLNRITLVFAFVPLVTFLIPYVSINLTVWCMWLVFYIAAYEIPFIYANRKIRDLKQKRGWNRVVGEEVRYVEIKSAGEVRRVRFLPFLLPIVISVLAAVFCIVRFYDKELMQLAFVILLLAVLTPFFYVMAVCMDRLKVEVISTDSEANLGYARAKKNVWKNLWLSYAWMHTLYTVFSAVVIGTDPIEMQLLLWGSIVYSIAVIALLYPSLRKLRRVDASYAASRDLPEAEEDDKYWIGGMIYYNKNDRHVLVSMRNGTGTTLNLATPAGIAMEIIGALALLSLPVLCIWVMLLEFTPIHLSVEEQVLKAEHLRVDYAVPLEDIEEISVIAELPEWSRTNGTGMADLNKGTFYIRNEGKCEAFVNPRNTIFLRVEAMGKTYYFSGSDDEETRSVMAELSDFLTHED